MPIYGKTLTPPPWILEKKLNKNKILQLRFIFNKVLKNETNGVQQTLVPNTDYTIPYLYAYDSTKYPGLIDNYSTNLECLISRANVELAKDKVYGKDYRFDIMGNWSFGNIIIMKRSDMLASDYKKQVDKYNKKVNKTINKIAKALD